MLDIFLPKIQRWLTLLFFKHVIATSPISRKFGIDRGLPIDRFFIEHFLAGHSRCIKGRVLEVGSSYYSRKFGGPELTQSEVLNPCKEDPKTTIVGDLVTGQGIPVEFFDCIVLTQTLHVLPDFQGALKTCWKSLKPNGMLLATFPGISQISRYDMDRWGDFWRFTSASVNLVIARVFPNDNTHMMVFGNAKIACGFLLGLCASDLTRKELFIKDPDYELLIAISARK